MTDNLELSTKQRDAIWGWMSNNSYITGHPITGALVVDAHNLNHFVNENTVEEGEIKLQKAGEPCPACGVMGVNKVKEEQTLKLKPATIQEVMSK